MGEIKNWCDTSSKKPFDVQMGKNTMMQPILYPHSNKSGIQKAGLGTVKKLFQTQSIVSS